MFEITIMVILLIIALNFKAIIEGLATFGGWLVKACIGLAAAAIVLYALLESVEKAVGVVVVIAIIYAALPKK